MKGMDKMKLYTCSMHDCYIGESFLLGIFSTRDGAEHQAHVWLSGLGMGFELIDYDNEYNFYRAENGRHYTAHFEEFTLNELSF